MVNKNSRNTDFGKNSLKDATFKPQMTISLKLSLPNGNSYLELNLSYRKLKFSKISLRCLIKRKIT